MEEAPDKGGHKERKRGVQEVCVCMCVCMCTRVFMAGRLEAVRLSRVGLAEIILERLQEKNLLCILHEVKYNCYKN